MHRSKIFLGVTSRLLVVAGLADSKKFASAATRYYCSANFFVCKRAMSTCVYTSVGHSTLRMCTISFTQGGDILNAWVYTEGRDNCPCDATRSIHKITYTKL